MTAITSSNLFSLGWTNLRDFIKDNVVDPRTGNLFNNRPDFILSKDPRLTELAKKQLPLIVLLPIDFSDEPITLDRCFKDKTPSVTIIVYEDYDRNLANFDSLADRIDVAMTGSDLVDTRESLGFFSSALSSSTPSDFELNNKRIQVRTMIYTFSSMLNV